jgi:hypothetical protein
MTYASYGISVFLAYLMQNLETAHVLGGEC